MVIKFNTIILDGKKVALEVKQEVKKIVEGLNVKPKLVVISVGNDPASKVYIKMKKKACEEAGILFDNIKLDEKIKTQDLINKIKSLNKDNKVNGILVQLPLPAHINKRNIIDSINPLKDVDGLTSINIGKTVNGDNGIIPCTALGIIKILDYYNISIESKHVVIVGRSELVGKPLINLFLNKNATVTSLNSYTTDIKKHTKAADILVVAAGKKYLINKTMVSKDAVIIDVGINKEDKLYGDVNPDVKEIVKAITPVPGGVGPMTVATLLENVINCYRKQGLDE